MANKLGGSMVALVTPMQENGDIDTASVEALVEWHIEQGTDGIVVVGTTGESPTLTMGEQEQLIRQVVEQVAGRVPVVAGTGTNSTEKTLAMTLKAKEAGADACLIVTPYYNKPTQEGLYQHFKIIAESIDIPQILYNVPPRTACDLLPATVARLSGLPNIVGLKEATGDLTRLTELKATCQAHLIDFYSGDDVTACDFMLQGGHGVISVTANVVPNLMAQLCQAATQDESEQARALNDRLLPLHRALFLESNPIPVKWAVHAMGKIPGFIRLPLTPLTKPNQVVLYEQLQALGVLVHELVEE